MNILFRSKAAFLLREGRFTPDIPSLLYRDDPSQLQKIRRLLRQDPIVQHEGSWLPEQRETTTETAKGYGQAKSSVDGALIEAEATQRQWNAEGPLSRV